jgi:beta-lactam-binding protein with PASTA domain
VPDVRRLTLAEAEARVNAQPLTAELVYKPAVALQRPGIVVDQQPRKGYRSSYDSIILVVSKATHGVIPSLVGTRLDRALLKLRKLKLQPQITYGSGKPGTVLEQEPAPGLAAAPGLKVELVVARDAARTAAAGG